MMLFLGLIVAAGLWYFSRSGNSASIKGYIEDHGGKLLSDEWEPFGKGWFGENNESIYKIKYRDADGNIRDAWAKTSLFTVSIYLKTEY